ncbi:hypothetical protein [Streptomyces sp. NPDC059894]|uniref:hypothetical protein n=1 Tax=unclassified Streptomyces TaxID=2593676 RepID=UPI0036566AFC
MATDLLPDRVREFADYLDGLLARLDQGAGWCAVFWQRDPDGMRACLDGHEVPPWDVVEALLQDLAAEYGTPAAAQDAERARPLHLAALVAHDDRPGGRAALEARLDGMLREQRHAVERQAELGRLLAAAADRDEVDALRLDLAWAHDDHDRATARCAELRYRIAEADRRAQDGRTRTPHPTRRTADDPAPSAGASTYADAPSAMASTYADAPSAMASTYADAPSAGASTYTDAPTASAFAHADRPTATASADPNDPTASAAPAPASAPAPDQAAPLPTVPAPGPAPTPKQRKRRRGSARFAGLVEEETAAPVVVPPAAEHALSTTASSASPSASLSSASPSAASASAVSASAGRRVPRGARFAGAAEAVAERPEPGGEAWAEPRDAVARRESAEAVARLVRLRAEGRSGEAHALLAELAYGPAARLPLLAADLRRAGLDADWTTLLWEAASLPADRLVAAADALAEAGRTADGEQILRQGVVRPADEIGEAVRGLLAQGRHPAARALLDAYVRVRTPEEAARSAAPDPQVLVPLLLEAARGVSDERHRYLAHALRVAGLTA